MNYWQHLELSNVDTPALIIHHDLVVKNIKAAISHAGGLERIRPHVKTHKMLEVAQLQMKEGITRFKCATISEAEMLGMAQAEDILIAYQPQGPKIDRVKSLIHKYPDSIFSVLVDNIDSARIMNKKFQDQRPLKVYIDINDGQNRTGIIPEGVIELVNYIVDCASIQLVGLHCYDGHIRMPDLDARIEAATSAFKKVIQLREAIELKFGIALNVIAGGSPSFTVHAQYHDVECSPGTFVFWDERYFSDYRELPFEKAAIVATRVISKIDEHSYCLDLGHKSIASEFPFPRVKFLCDFEITQIGHSEEHLVIKTEIPDVLKVGQILLGVPMHICPTVALYDSVHVFNGTKIYDSWKVIARDRKITI